MNLRRSYVCSAALLCQLAWAQAQAPVLKIKVLPLGATGVVEDLAAKDWKVTLGGQEAKVLSQRLPKELGKEGQKWVFVLLPVRDQEVRRMVVKSVATFMSTLPATDSALVVVRTAKGLECFTPGFTTRPSLWEQALVRVVAELPARLEGSPNSAFALPATSAAEKEEGMEPIQAFLAGLPARKFASKTDDTTNQKRSVTDSYSVDTFAGYTSTITGTLTSLERLGEALSTGPGERHLLIFSRNEVDDLANPIWSRKVHEMSKYDTLNSKLQTEMMIRDITLARLSLTNKLTQLGLTLHSVGGAGGNYTGAFGDAAQATGGFQFRFETDFVARLCELLPLWATRYELEVPLPAGAAHPLKLSVGTTRPNLRVYAPSAR